jgi:methylated-DNA-[protein]-cysteine S-methyltransferase
MDSPIGPIAITSDSDAIIGIHFHDQRDFPSKRIDAEQSRNPVLNKALHRSAEEQLREYFEGIRTEFDLPIRFNGTDFQIKVWEQLLCIPYGEICSYQFIADRIGATKAVRAVGGAIGKNPICIVAPCHRVLGKDKSLTGYAGGLDRKRFLLARESRNGEMPWRSACETTPDAGVLACR